MGIDDRFDPFFSLTPGPIAANDTVKSLVYAIEGGKSKN
jgi:hypothetical protein